MKEALHLSVTSRRRPTKSTVSADRVKKMLCTTVAEERDYLRLQHKYCTVVLLGLHPPLRPGLVSGHYFVAQDVWVFVHSWFVHCQSPPLSAGVGRGNRVTHWWHGSVVFFFLFSFSSYRSPTARSRGRSE